MKLITSIEKLKETELIYGNLLETIDVGFYQVALDGQMLNHNRAHNIILGYSPLESLENTDVRKFWQNPKDRDKYIEHLLNQGYTKNYICHALKKDGNKIIVELNSHLIKDENGNPIRIDGTFIDVTEKIKLEKKLKESEERYRLISENANDLIRVLNDKFEFEYINEKVHERVLGYAKDELLGKTHLPFLHLEDRRQAIRSTVKNLKRGEGSYQARFKDNSGIYKWFEFAGKIFFNSKGEKKVLSIARNINDRKLAELKLEESEEKYRLISENANEIITVQNEKFQIEYINEIALKNILGYSSREVIGKQVLQFAHPDDKKETILLFNELLKKSVRPLYSRYRHKDGHYVWLEINLETYFNSQGEKKYLTISRDITKIKEAEQKLTKSEKKYREAYSRANFYRDLFAHDINNILHIIGSSAELISYHLGDSEKSKVIEDIGNIIKKQVKRGAKLVSNVHTLSKLEEEEINAQPVEICSLMENAIDFIRKSYNDRTIHINNECEDDDHITVNANELLQDVFENILLNGVKYNENSKVEIRIIISKIIKTEGKEYSKIEFSDNGIGVPDDRKEIIFKHGNREFKGAKGMGLGLSLVKKILKSFNGKIWVEDRVKGDYSKGSNFIILLPELNLKE